MRELQYIKEHYPQYWDVLKDYAKLNNKGLLTLCVYIKHIITLFNDYNIYINNNNNISSFNFYDDIEEKMTEYNKRINLLDVASVFKARYNSDYFVQMNELLKKKIIIDLSMFTVGYWYQLYYFYIYLPVPDPMWFKKLIMRLLPHVHSKVEDEQGETLMKANLIEQKYKILMQIYKLPYIKRTENQKRQIIYDFSKIGIYEKEERVNLYTSFFKALQKTDYKRFVNYSEDQYYARLIQKIKHRFIKGDFKYKKYVMKDVPSKQRNSYYVEVQEEESIHPDLIVGNSNMVQYLKNMRLFRTLQEWKLLYNVLISKFPFKLVLIRNVIKDAMEDEVQYMKNKGYISLYNLEIFLGYRCDNTDKQDIIDQMIKNYDAGNHKYGNIQRDFFRKHVDKAFNAYFNGKSFLSVLNKKHINEKIFGDFQSTYGAAGSSTMHQETNKGKRIMTKTQFFAQLKSDNTEEIEKEHRKDPNYIIIKKETVKQRVVVNASLGTYPALARIAKVITNCYNGVTVNYNLMTKDQKAELYGRLCKYTIHNTYKNNDYLLLPLDYSSFDTTITKELILETLRYFCGKTPYDMDRDIDYFEKVLKRTKIKYRDYDLTRNYKYGVLSGWKITNCVESLLNYVVSYGVTQELGLDLKDIITMGDDLILVIKKPNLSEDEQQEVLHNISEIYARVGFKVHNIKNMVGYRMIEFLRNTYYNNVVLPYPLRALTSLTYRQPTSGIDFVNYSGYLGNLQKYIIRTGSYIESDLIIRKYMSKSVNSNIKQFGYAMYVNPLDYELKNENFYDYVTSIKNIKDTVLYRDLNYVFDGKYANYIEHYIKYNILSSKLTKEVIKRKNRTKEDLDNNKKLNILVREFFKNLKCNSRVLNLELETYNFYINEIFVQILTREKYNFNVMKQYMMDSISRYYFKIGRVRVQNVFIFSLVTTKAGLKEIITDYRLRSEYNYYNNIIANRIKQKLYRFLIFKFMTTNHRFLDKKKQNYLSRKQLGYSLFDYSVGVLTNSGYYTNVFINVD